MDKNLEDNIKTYQMKKQEMDNNKQRSEALKKQLEQIIADLTKRLEEVNLSVDEKINASSQELQDFSDSHRVKIRLEDILNEILEITGIDYEDIKISGYHTNNQETPYSTLKLTNYDEYIRLVAEYTPNPVEVKIIIKSTNDSIPFDMTISFKSCMSDIQSDGKMLIDHSHSLGKTIRMGLWNHQEHKTDVFYTRTMYYFYDNENNKIEDILCSFSLKQIINFQNDNNLLSQAILNCLNNPKKEKQKTLSL